MCETSNPSPSPAAQTLEATTGLNWSCVACTMVNPIGMRVCAVCGTLNPRPVFPLGLRLCSSKALKSEENASLSSSSEEIDEDSDNSVQDARTCGCKNFDTLSDGHTCSKCFMQRSKIAKKSIDKVENVKNNVDKKTQLNKQKRCKRKVQDRMKVAYGISLFELKKLITEPSSSRLTITLQTLTHTLAMMDASADNEWADRNSFLIHGFSSERLSDTAKDPELLTVLVNIFRGQDRTYPGEVRHLAIQSINYLMKLDRHIFERGQMEEVVRLYISDLSAWNNQGNIGTGSGSDLKISQMIVEECLSGLSSACNAEAFAVRELLAHNNLDEYLKFLLSLVDGNEEGSVFHPNTVMTALDILQKCCVKLRWRENIQHEHYLKNDNEAHWAASFNSVGEFTSALATKLIVFLHHALQHKHIPLRVKAAKCLMLIFDFISREDPESIVKLVTSELLLKFVAVIVKYDGEESEDSRLAMVNLLLHLFDTSAQLVQIFVRKNIYVELFNNMLQLLQSSSKGLRTSTLKLIFVLTRSVCTNHTLRSTKNSQRQHTNGSPSLAKQNILCKEGFGSGLPRKRQSRQRLNSLTDPDVPSTLLHEFIRVDSIAAVNVLLNDGVDLNPQTTFDEKGNEIDKPLNVAVEFASLDMVRFLLKRGADLHQIGINGTALHVAARCGRCDIAAILLQCGARVQAKDRKTNTVMDVANATDKEASESTSKELISSPMRMLLEFYQRSADNDSNLFESDEMPCGNSSSWLYPSDYDDHDEDEDLDDDEDDKEEYLMNHDDGDNGDEGLVGAGQFDVVMDDDEVSSDEDLDNYDGDSPSELATSDQHRLDKFLPGLSKSKKSLHTFTGIFTKRKTATSLCDKGSLNGHTSLDLELVHVKANEVYEFSRAVIKCLLLVLHKMDIQKVERSVMSTLACVLEVAPSQLIQDLKEEDINLVLDTVHFLLRGEKRYQSRPDVAKSWASKGALPFPPSSSANVAAQSNLLSYILAVRILQATGRKLPKKSGIYYQIERRGITEQLEQLNDPSACWVSPTRDKATPWNPRGTIFGRGLDLLNMLRADMVESGTLHLYKLRNLAKRLREFSDWSRPCDQSIILVDLVDLFRDPNSITTYELKQSMLLPAILQYLSPHDELHEGRRLVLMQAFECRPMALKHLISRLQTIITQEESFPLTTFTTGKGRELYPLTRQVKVTFIRSAGNRQHESFSSRPEEKSIRLSPLTHFQSFERTVFRSMPVIDSNLSLLYLNLVGHSIQKVVEGKWKKYLVVGFDDTRSCHLVKAFGGTDESFYEVVLHDSQCKLIGSVDVYENVALDLKLFGSPFVNDSGDNKRKKRSKRKRKFLSQVKPDSDRSHQVEVRNTNVLNLSSLPGAWYAAVLWNERDDVSEPSDKKCQRCEEVLAAQAYHSVKLLIDDRIVRNLPADCIRPRAAQPQVGSVVAIDGGPLGEVVCIHKNDCMSSETSAIALDVMMKSGVEKKRVVMNRVRFPPQKESPPEFEKERIKASSIQKLFSARANSLLTGSVGDRVWVLPPLGSSVKNLCVAGTIKAFPPGLSSVGEISTVIVEVAFGNKQAPLAVKVNRNQVLNLGIEGSALSCRTPSRLLAALQTMSDRRRSSLAFGGHNSSTFTIHRAFGRVAESLQQNQHGYEVETSGTAVDQLRNLISRSSILGACNPISGVYEPDHIQRATQDAAGSNPPDDMIGGEVQTVKHLLASHSPTDSKSIRLHKVNCIDDTTVKKYLTPQDAKPKMTCSRLPKVGLVMGFRNCNKSVTAPNRVEDSSKIDLRSVKKISNDKHAAPHYGQLDLLTQQFEITAEAREALLDIFNSFIGDPSSGAKQKKRRRKVRPSIRNQEAGMWDIEKFIDFMHALCGLAKDSHSDLIPKHCMTFSKFADPATNRKLLRSDGFVSFISHECKDFVKLKQLTQFLLSRGFAENLLSSDGSRSNSRNDCDYKSSPNGGECIGNDLLQQPVVLRGFPADQNILKCVEELRCEYRAKACPGTPSLDTGPTAPDITVPPWKLTYKLYCDFQVDWEAPIVSDANDSLGLHASLLESFEKLKAKPFPQLLEQGVVALDGMSASGVVSTKRWPNRITASQAYRKVWDKSEVRASVADAVSLLRCIFQYRRKNVALLDEAIWINPRLCNKLETQMQDILSMCSGMYPPWCDALVAHCKFFFPRKLRENLFRSTSFGCTRSLHWFRSQLNLGERVVSSSSSTIGSSDYNQGITISPIPKERVKVLRTNILQSAEAVMKMHAKRKAILDVVFDGEKGYGSGVTAAFYSSTAHALQAVKENCIKRYWIPGEDDDARAQARHTDSADGIDDITQETIVIRHPNGLFPYPHHIPDSELVNRFRLIGRLAGKALMDERLLPLPLSPQFIKLVLGETVALEELGVIFLSHGRILYSMYEACQKLAAGEINVQIDEMNIHEWLGAVGFTFIDPFSQEPLVIGGDDIVVSVSNLTVYVRAVLEFWLESGIRAQVLAFREGISEVLPLEKLKLLFVPELLSLLCGEQDIQWNAESLAKDTKLAHGFTKDSQPIKWLFNVLEAMSATERRAFLLYATGCPNLPPGGFQALKPPFEVVRRVVDNLDVDRALPFARTCTNTLHLPAYSSKKVLAQQMMFAIANSRGTIDRD
ncbi:putative HECT domain, Zinc finger, RanBP2-type, ankyrin repeat-containing domain-containing protein [Plasmopara halstedii]